MQFLKVVLAANQMLLINDSTTRFDYLFYLNDAILKNTDDWSLIDWPDEDNSVLPRKRKAFLAARPLPFQKVDEDFENAAMEDGRQLLFGSPWSLCDLIAVKLDKIIFPLNENLIADDRLILVFWNLEISQKS